MQLTLTADELALIVEPTARRGSTSRSVHAIAALKSAGPGDLSFLGNTKYKAEVAQSAASVILVPPDYEGEPQPEQELLVVGQPSAALARVCARIEQNLWPQPAPGIHASAVVDPSVRVPDSAVIGPLCVVEAGAVIGERTHLQAQVFVGREAVIGSDCWLMPGAKVTARCVLHDRVRLHAGVVVGADGFGYEFQGGRHEKVPQVGIVEIESDVEIGANSTLDRARFSRTWVGEGTKIDNLVQIAHNVVIGKHCMICAQVGISGSTTLGDFVVLGGQVGTVGHITIGTGAKAGGQAGIISDLEPGVFVNGTPAVPYMLERRIAVLQRRLPDLFKRFETLVDDVNRLKKTSAS